MATKLDTAGTLIRPGMRPPASAGSLTHHTCSKLIPRLSGELMREAYARVELRGPEFVAAYLTPDAAELGLTVALPETVSVAMASPAGFEPATCRLEGGRSVL